jgi:hypothetical protein
LQNRQKGLGQILWDLENRHLCDVIFVSVVKIQKSGGVAGGFADS